MKRIALTFAFLLSAVPASATSYFMSPTGNDSNNGLSSGSPWLSPLHAVNCGDTITAAAGTYSTNNFGSGKWGTVTCAGGNNVAWVICATFDACKITAVGTQGMKISASYWGVQGFEATGSGTNAGCFQARPPTSGASIHHIIFANSIANVCNDGGFSAYNNGNASVDYIVYVGNIAYDAAHASADCTSGFNIYQPVKSDSAAGTHMYIAGNFAWANVNPNPCAGTAPTDGEGIILDTFDGSQGGLPAPYDQQAVVYNNMVLGNGGRGVLVNNNSSGGAHAPVFVEYVTAWSNNLDTHQNSGGACGNMEILNGLNIQMLHNLSMPTTATGCGSFNNFAYYLATGDSSDVMDQSWLFSAAGHNCGIQAPPNGFSCGGSNLTGTNPSFMSASTPGAPSCGAFATTVACMATVISNFTPTAGGASAYGYQPVSNTSIVDPLFPPWLCNVNLPPGLVTPGCGAAGSVVQRRR
jgi:hypothetical protein